MVRPATKAPDVWRREIKDNARRLFAQKGYPSVSVEEIMREVGAAKGMFYRSFPSKDALLEELVADWQAEYAGGIKAALEDDGATISSKFADVTAIMLRMAKRTDEIAPFFSHPKDSGGSLGMVEDAMIATLVPSLEKALESACANGEIQIEDAAFTARFLICGSLGALNAGRGTPLERIQGNSRFLPTVVERVLKTGPNPVET